MKWSNLKLKQLPEFFKLCAIKSNDLVEMYDRDMALLSIVTGKNIDYFNAMSPKEFSIYRERLLKFIEDIPNEKYIPAFKHNGRKYTLVVSINSVTVDQLASVHQLKIDENNYYSQLPFVVALFSKEVTWFKRKLSFTEKAEQFKDLPADIGMSLSLFFCKVFPLLEKAMATSLRQKINDQMILIKKEIQKVKKQSLKGGGG